MLCHSALPHAHHRRRLHTCAGSQVSGVPSMCLPCSQWLVASVDRACNIAACLCNDQCRHSLTHRAGRRMGGDTRGAHASTVRYIRHNSRTCQLPRHAAGAQTAHSSTRATQLHSARSPFGHTHEPRPRSAARGAHGRARPPQRAQAAAADARARVAQRAERPALARAAGAAQRHAPARCGRARRSAVRAPALGRAGLAPARAGRAHSPRRAAAPWRPAPGRTR